MFWYRIVDWFNDLSERNRIVRNFNKSARDAFILGAAPTLLEARITKGDSSYKHTFSKWNSGFRIKAMSGRALSRDEMITIGNVILSNSVLIRQLVALGWDTLEVHDDTGSKGLKWPLRKFILELPE